MSIRSKSRKLTVIALTASLAAAIAGLSFETASFASGPANGTQVPGSDVPIGTFTAATPFSSGQNIEVKIPANSNFTPSAKVNILECSDPAGTAANLPTSVSQCDGNTIQGSTVFINSDGSVTVNGYPVYALPDAISLGEPAITTPVCNPSNECVLFIGEDENNFAGSPHYFSEPFFVAANGTDNGAMPGDGSAQKTQTITFTTNPPSPAVVGGTYTPAATGGASGNPVVFSIDASSTAGACSLSGAVVHLTGAGTCKLDANQAGDVPYGAAPQVRQTFTITSGTKTGQTITFTTNPPSPAVVGGTYTPAATGGASGNPVVFSIDASSTAGACSLSGAVVHLTGAGTCKLDANQAGNASYNAATQVSQSFTIGTAGPGFTSANSTSATEGTSFSFRVTTSGTPTPKIKGKGKLPKGVKFHKGIGTATMSGTPTATKHKSPVGTYHLTITATFGKGKTKHVVTQAFTLTVIA